MGTDDKPMNGQDLERYGVWVKAGPDDISQPSEISFDDGAEVPGLADTAQGSLDETVFPTDDIMDEDFTTINLDNDEIGQFDPGVIENFDDTPETHTANTSSDMDSSMSGLNIDEAERFDSRNDARLKELEKKLSDQQDEIYRLNDAIHSLRMQAAQDDAEQPKGFFEEDGDDETIALTGDELDNILNSSDMIDGNNEIIDLTSDDSGFGGNTEIDTVEIEEDPAISILESPSDQDELVNIDDIIEFDESPSADYSAEDMEIPSLDDIADNDAALEDVEEIDIEGMTQYTPQEESVTEVMETGIGSSADEPAEDLADDMLDFEISDETAAAPEETEQSADDTFMTVDVEELKHSEDFDLPEIADEAAVLLDDAPAEMELSPPKNQERMKTVLTYMNQLLEFLPNSKFQEFARSEYFKMYNEMLEELGIPT